MSPFIISIIAFFGVAALVGGVAMLLRGDDTARTEDRLAMLTAGKSTAGRPAQSSVLSQPLDATQKALAEFLSRFRNLSLLFMQADTSLTPAKFFVITASMAFAGTVAAAFTGMNPAIVPVFTILSGFLPLFWLMFRRKRRCKHLASNCRTHWN